MAQLGEFRERPTRIYINDTVDVVGKSSTYRGIVETVPQRAKDVQIYLVRLDSAFIKKGEFSMLEWFGNYDDMVHQKALKVTVVRSKLTLVNHPMLLERIKRECPPLIEEDFAECRKIFSSESVPPQEVFDYNIKSISRIDDVLEEEYKAQRQESVDLFLKFLDDHPYSKFILAYHGTSNTALERITTTSKMICGPGGGHGQGIYFGSDPATAFEYANDGAGKGSDKLLVCAVAYIPGKLNEDSPGRPPNFVIANELLHLSPPNVLPLFVVTTDKPSLFKYGSKKPFPKSVPEKIIDVCGTPVRAASGLKTRGWLGGKKYKTKHRRSKKIKLQ
jgi:hypothetical protein